MDAETTRVDQQSPIPPPYSIHTKDHLVVVINVYHRRADGSVKSANPRFTTVLETSDEIYRREVAVGGAWETVDTAWVKDPSCVVIEVLTGDEVLIGVPQYLSGVRTGGTQGTQRLQASQAAVLISPQEVRVQTVPVGGHSRIRVTAIPH